MHKFLKYRNAEYVMPILFCNALYIPVFSELFGKNSHQIKYAYGAVKSTWSNGRISTLNINRLDYIDKYLSKMKEYNVVPTFTFTNPSVTDEELNDKYCNVLLDIAQQYKSHFIVADEKLYNYIKSRYPEANMVCSVIVPSIKYCEGNFDETDFYNRMLDKYEIVVVRPEWTAENLDNLEKIVSDISRIEVLINQHCQYNCMVCKRHYELIKEFECSRVSMQEYETQLNSFCPKNKPEYRSVYMEPEFVDKLVEKGITKLKLQGRNYPFMELFDDIYRYMFNDKISKEELKQQFYKTSAEIIHKNNLAQLNLL